MAGLKSHQLFDFYLSTIDKLRKYISIYLLYMCFVHEDFAICVIISNPKNVHDICTTSAIELSPLLMSRIRFERRDQEARARKLSLAHQRPCRAACIRSLYRVAPSHKRALDLFKLASGSPRKPIEEEVSSRLGYGVYTTVLYIYIYICSSIGRRTSIHSANCSCDK